MQPIAPIQTGLLTSATVRFRHATVRTRLVLTVAALTGLLLVASLVSLSTGPVVVPLNHVAAALFKPLGIASAPVTQTESQVVLAIRLPRIAAGILVGMSLGVAGTAMQGLFRNPMADPGIIGVSAGGAVGAVAAIVLGASAAFPFAVPLFAFLGAMAAAATVYGIAGGSGRVTMSTLLLAGVAVNSFLGAVISATIVMVPKDDALRGILFWLAGGLDGRSWTHVQVAAPIVLLGTAAILLLAKDLNLLLLGDDDARSLGVRVDQVRPALLVAACLITGAAVAVSGIIGFVGLVAPHVLRIFLGPDHRVLLPASALGGAVFVVGADTIARSVISPAELQVGVLISLVGAPFFLFLLTRTRRRTEALR